MDVKIVEVTVVAVAVDIVIVIVIDIDVSWLVVTDHNIFSCGQ